MMGMVCVWVLVVMPHETKAWHRQRGQEEPHETQATESSDTRVNNPPSHCTASLAAIPHERHREASMNDWRRWHDPSASQGGRLHRK